MDAHLNRAGIADDTGRWLLLLRPRSSKVRALADMALSHGDGGDLIPMVLLGLLVDLLS